MVIHKAYKYRLKPTEEQEIMISKTFGCCRFIYNKMLGDKIEYYQENKTTLNNTPAQYKEEFEWLKEVDSLALANEQLKLQSAFKNFFRGLGNHKNIGFPKFKSKRRSKRSYTTNNIKNTIRIEGKTIKLPKLGNVAIVLHRQLPNGSKIKSCSISQKASGEYYISILTEYEYESPKINLDKSKSIGLDYSSPKFYIDSQDIEFWSPKYYRAYEEKLSKENRKLSNMKLHSKNYDKQKKKIARIYEKIANCRSNFLHNQSRYLVRTYDYICIEDLNMQAISQCLKLGKSTMDNGWGEFVNQLSYKSIEEGKKLIKVDKWFASSKTCNHCGSKYEKLQLNERQWVCPSCGVLIERDYNAAKNILQEGLRLVG